MWCCKLHLKVPRFFSLALLLGRALLLDIRWPTRVQCVAKLRTQWCRPNGTATQSATFHGLSNIWANDTAAGVAYAEQAVASFLLARGNWSWLG